MLLMSLWWGQTALFQQGLVAWITGLSAVSLACFAGGLLSGMLQPEGIRDEEMSALSSLLVATMVGIGGISLLVLVGIAYP